MSMMRCDDCSKLVDTDEWPESLYVGEENGYRKRDGSDCECLCSDCFTNREMQKSNLRSGK
jgi:hypothetical protein